MRAPLAVALAGALLLAASAPAVASAAAAPAAAPPGPTATTVLTLVTGDTVVLQGARSVRVLPAATAGIGADLQTVHLGERSYVVPAAARPYLGRYLDPALFDVTALAAQPAGRRLAVRLSLRPGAVPHLPGVTITSRTSTSATGYLTADSAVAFGRALDASWARDSAAGWPADSALFEGVTGMAPAAVVAPVAPAFPQVTFSLRLLDAAGKVVRFGAVTLVNTDDARRYVGFAIVNNGVARVSVPYGHYSALGDVTTYDRATGQVRSLLVPVSDLEVTQPGQTLVMDGRTATTRPAISTPRPATAGLQTVEWDRADRSGRSSVASGFTYDLGADVLVAPAPPAAVGTEHWLDEWALSGAQGGRSYTYDLAYSADHVPADQSYTVTDSGLATVQARYWGRAHTQGAFGRIPVLPYQAISFGFLSPIPVPLQRTEYVLAGPTVLWLSALIDSVGPTGFSGFVDDGLRHFDPGAQSNADWLRPALLPGVPVPTRADPAPLCAACRSGNVLTVVLAAFTDSTPGHVGSLSSSPDGSPVARFQLYAGDRRIVDRTDTTGVELPVAKEPESYRIVFDEQPPGAVTSTAAHTELTFRSGAGQGPQVPDDWRCLGPYVHSCRALPVLQVRAPLPVDLTGHLPVGSSAAEIDVTHAPGAVATGIRAVTVETRVAGGAWQPAAVARVTEGSYSASLDNPGSWAGRAVDLRITATDADGGTISQTTERAYVVADS